LQKGLNDYTVANKFVKAQSILFQQRKRTAGDFTTERGGKRL